MERDREAIRYSGSGRQEFLTTLSAKPDTVKRKVVSEELMLSLKSCCGQNSLLKLNKQKNFSIHIKEERKSAQTIDLPD